MTSADRASQALAQAARILEHVDGRRVADVVRIKQVRDLIDSAAFALRPEQPAPLPEPVGANAPGVMSTTRRTWDGQWPEGEPMLDELLSALGG